MPETPELILGIFSLGNRALQKFKVAITFSSASLALPLCAHFREREGMSIWLPAETRFANSPIVVLAKYETLPGKRCCIVKRALF